MHACRQAGRQADARVVKRLNRTGCIHRIPASQIVAAHGSSQRRVIISHCAAFGAHQEFPFPTLVVASADSVRASIHALTHSLTHSLTQPPTHLLTHKLLSLICSRLNIYSLNGLSGIGVSFSGSSDSRDRMSVDIQVVSSDIDRLRFHS